jgi:hypothetical protein
LKDIKVTSQFIGRLGNNMFQTAAAIGYAKKYNVGWGVPRVNRESPDFHKFFPNLPICDEDFRRYNFCDPSQFDYKEIPFHGSGVKLVGFFQSLKYFEHCQEDVKKAFKLNIQPIDAVSIHVRRGDYVMYDGSFPPITMDYIEEAFQRIPNREGRVISKTKYIVFSDDIKWCRENFGPYGCGDFEFSEGRNEFEDMSLMASCKHHIIANSTFSWWGAYLGHNPDKIIVSPSQEGFNWFGPANGVKNPKDLIPDNWIQIKFR